MNSRTRARSPASIGSNQSSRRWTTDAASDCKAGDVVLLLVMAQSPPACQRRIVWVSAPGDYAIRNSNHTPDGTQGNVGSDAHVSGPDALGNPIVRCICAVANENHPHVR